MVKHKLTPRENYLTALRGEVPEWIPHYTYGPPAPGAPAPANAMFEPPILGAHRFSGGGKDIWGVNYIPTESTGNALIPDNRKFILPIDKITHWRDVIKAPDLSGIDWEQMCREGLEQQPVDRTQTALFFSLHVGYFQLLMSFTGFEDGLLAFYEEPEAVHELLEYLSEFYMKIADATLGIVKPDILMLADDTAAWNSPFISADMYREFILPHHEKFAKRGRERGLLMTMHNCGKCESVIDMLVEMGINGWDPAQSCNDLAGIKRKYGNKLLITGGWDARGRLLAPDVTEEEIRQSVRDVIDSLAPGGGYAFAGGYLVPNGNTEAARRNAIVTDEAARYCDIFYTARR
ncbi:MAG: veratrol--corrinoid protein metyltransferase [Oscillospiraceae bacterium]|jgi:hypothetical protein|nr:veratrol--corrinoid protein metyltransferase [Oscillospiraceae bacterium]